MRGLLAVLPSMTLGLSPTPVPVSGVQAPLVAPALSGSAPGFALSLTPLPAPAAPAPVPAVAPLHALTVAASAMPAALRADLPSEQSRAAAGEPFGEGPAAARPPALEPWGTREPRYRLAPLGFEDLDPPSTEAPPPPRAPEPKPFLLRHYRLARFFAAPLVHLIYAVRANGLAHLPAGPALIVPNHVSFMDPVLISFVANRPMRFLMYRGIYETRGLEWLFRSLGAIPISPKDPKNVIEESLYRARRALAAGETVVVFPEGMLTRDGSFNVFRRGFERVAVGTGAPVIPAYIDGIWGSAFSRHPKASFLRGVLSRLRGRRRVSVSFGPALPRADAALARDAVARLAAPPK